MRLNKLTFICSIIFLFFFVITIWWKLIEFSMGCQDHLKRAADANTVQTAKVELRTALAYLQVNNLTEGNSSIIFKLPRNDIGFWYNNLNESLKELESVPDSASQLERSNILMKLRGTILDETDKGTKVTHPSWLQVYPSQFATVGIFIIISLVSCISGILSWAELDESRYAKFERTFKI